MRERHRRTAGAIGALLGSVLFVGACADDGAGRADVAAADSGAGDTGGVGDAGESDAGADAGASDSDSGAEDSGAGDATSDTGAGDATSDTGAGDATPDTGGGDATPDTGAGDTTTADVPDMAAPIYGVTHIGLDGNRALEGTAALPVTAPLDVTLPAPAVWVVAVCDGSSSVWVSMSADGAATATRVADGVAQTVPVMPASLPAGMPPLVRLVSGAVSLILPQGASALTAPIVTEAGVTVWIGDTGAVIADGVNVAPTALPDARPVTVGGRVAVLTAPTPRYAHGVLGDATEAAAVSLIDPGGGGTVVIPIPAPDVIEGISTIWADLDEDGARELIVTLSNESDGARVAAFTEAGAPLAAGPPIGQGYRWRHQLAVAPFGPAGEVELAVIKTPHIGGIVELYRRAGDALEIVATRGTYRTHSIGSRNLDLALAADLDGDGRTELLVPNQEQSSLAAVRHTAQGLEEPWSLDLGGPGAVGSNLAACRHPDGGISVGLGLTDGRLRVWPR